MANKQHLDILKRGVEMWNQWRREHADVKPDLSGADLSGARVWRTTFRAVDLSVAKGESGAPPMAPRLYRLIRAGLAPKGLHWARFLLEELPSSVASMERETSLELSKDATWSGKCIVPLAA